MPGFIVSVRGLQEAQQAFAGGADVIDLKEPNQGALGQPAMQIISETIAGMPNTATFSLACGELSGPTHFPPLGPHARRISFAKIGAAKVVCISRWRRRFENFRAQLPCGVQGVPAAYADFRKADSLPPLEILSTAATCGAKGILLDTFCKRSGSIFEIMSEKTLAGFVERARQLGLWVAIAGSIGPKDLGSKALLRSRYVAMRGAICEHERTSNVSADKVRRIAQQLRSQQPSRCGGEFQTTARIARD